MESALYVHTRTTTSIHFKAQPHPATSLDFALPLSSACDFTAEY